MYTSHKAKRPHWGRLLRQDWPLSALAAIRLIREPPVAHSCGRSRPPEADYPDPAKRTVEFVLGGVSHSHTAFEIIDRRLLVRWRPQSVLFSSPVLFTATARGSLRPMQPPYQTVRRRSPPTQRCRPNRVAAVRQLLGEGNVGHDLQLQKPVQLVCNLRKADHLGGRQHLLQPLRIPSGHGATLDHSERNLSQALQLRGNINSA